MNPEHEAATARDGGDENGGAAATVSDGSDMTCARRRSRLDWSAILTVAAPLVCIEIEKVGIPPTLRRVHYLLVSDQTARARVRQHRELLQVTVPIHHRGADLAGVPIRADGMPDWPDVDAREADQRRWLRDVATTAGEAV